MTWSLEKIAAKTGLNKTLLELLTKLSNRERFSDKERDLYQAELVSFIANQEASQPVSSFSLLLKQKTQLSAETLLMLGELRYRTRHLTKISSDLETIYQEFQQSPEALTISPAQYGQLVDLAALQTLLENLDNLGLIQGNSQLEELYQNSNYAAQIVEQFDMEFKTTAIQTPQAKTSNGSTLNAIYSDQFCLKLDELIKADNKNLLEKHYGADWLNQVEKRFAVIQQEQHDKALQLDGLIANKSQKHPHHFHEHQNNSIREVLNKRREWEELREDNTKLICSEFMANTLSETLNLLNKELVKEITLKADGDVPKEILINPLTLKEGELNPVETVLNQLAQQDLIIDSTKAEQQNLSFKG